MGSRESVLDSDTRAEVDLCSAARVFEERWRGQEVPCSVPALSQRLGFRAQGLASMFRQYPDSGQAFFASTLAHIVHLAGQLPELLPALRLKRLVQQERDRLALPRRLVASLLAHMFLCTIPEDDRSEAMPAVRFDRLLGDDYLPPQEVAKLRMFVHYFERVRGEPPQGELRIHRQVRQLLPEAEQETAWADSQQPLLEIEAVEMHVGFEDVARGEGCLHADFANMFIGGGVLSGGCVQEEIRFAICPELCATLLVCPCMLPNEAITVVGGEQFSAYKGYGRSLRFGGPFRHPSPRVDQDGTPLVAITAMDAIDFRSADSSLETQMSSRLELRELEKAAAAFEPVDEAALKAWPVVATGNWGCGVFLGCPPLKAVLQWLAASEGGRRLRYFPFDLALGPELAALSRDLSVAGVTVGELFRALRGLGQGPPLAAAQLLRALREAALVPASGMARRPPKAKPGAEARASKRTEGLSSPRGGVDRQSLGQCPCLDS